MADEEIVYGGRIGAKVTYGRTVGGDLVPLLVDDDGKVSIAGSGLPSGAATSAKQDDLITAVGGKAAKIQIEITRPADTTQYAANTAIADAEPSATTHLLANMARANGGSGRIVRAAIYTDNVSWTQAVNLVIYKAAPADGFIADKGAYDDKYADKASIVGTIQFPGFVPMGAGAAGGIRVAVAKGEYLAYECAAGSKDLYFQIWQTGTPTPASAQKFFVVLDVEKD